MASENVVRVTCLPTTAVEIVRDPDATAITITVPVSVEPSPPPVAGPTIYDKSGQERDWAWLEERFGPVEIDGDGEYRAAELREVEGPSALVVRVLDQDGTPVEGESVAFFWPDAPIDLNAGYYGRCVVGETNQQGDVGFGMGPGAYYFPPDKGPHAVWIYGDGMSEMVDGLGMLGGTNHVHLDVTFRES